MKTRYRSNEELALRVYEGLAYARPKKEPLHVAAAQVNDIAVTQRGA